MSAQENTADIARHVQDFADGPDSPTRCSIPRR
jgi:hypothetical protein